MDDALLGEQLGAGKEAEVFAFGTRVAKIYRPAAGKAVAFREASIIAMVETTGLPVPAVAGVRTFGQRWGLIMDRAEGPPFAATMREKPHSIRGHVAAMADLHRTIHSKALPHLTNLKRRLKRNIVRASLADEEQRRVLAHLAKLPDGDALCHGDFHPFNIMGRPGAALIVDWLDAASGDPAADLARSYVLMHGMSPALAVAYVDAYTSRSAVSRKAVEAWVPVVAAARLSEGVPAEQVALLEMARSV